MVSIKYCFRVSTTAVGDAYTSVCVTAARGAGGGATELQVVPGIRVCLVNDKVFLLYESPEVIGGVGDGVSDVADRLGDGGGGES